MQSSIGRASSSWAESGALMTGLAAMVMRPCSWPSPGVAISSARHEHGTWPSTSGAPRTRLVQRPNSGSPITLVSAFQTSGSAIGLPNIIPPSTSKWPVRMLTTSTSQEARVPNSWLQRPMRP